MAIFLACEAVDDFVQSAIAAAGDDEVAAFVIRSLRDLRGLAGLCGLGKIRMDAAGGKNAAGFVKHGAAAGAAVASVGVVNQQRVMEIRGHPRCGPELVSASR